MNESRVMFTISELKIVTAQHVLDVEGIPSFVINKMDSAHAGVFGDIELYVDGGNAMQAREILEMEGVIESRDADLVLASGSIIDEDFVHESPNMSKVTYGLIIIAVLTLALFVLMLK